MGNRLTLVLGFCAVWLLSAAVKIHLADTIVFDFDIVPVVSLPWNFVHGGAFPVVGTLSSVAAYNMPGLQWLHLPMMAITDAPFLTLLTTMLFLNMLGTAAVFALGHSMFNARVAFLAAAVFTFSETSFAATSVAWAQFVLPSLTALVVLCLWRWRIHRHGVWMLGAGLIAVLAFMTHFSAILLFPSMLMFALASGARWRWRWLLLGMCGAALMLTPYMLFEVGRGFSDLRAFVTRDVQIPREVMAQYSALQGQTTPVLPAIELSAGEAQPMIASTTPPARTPPAIFNRVVSELSDVFTRLTQLSSTTRTDTPFNGVHLAVAWIAQASLAGMSFLALLTFMRHVRRGQGWRVILVTTHTGRFCLLIGFMLVYLAAMLVLRVYPSQQVTYLYGLTPLVIVCVCVALDTLVVWLIGSARTRWLIVISLCVGFALLAGTTRLMVVTARQDNMIPNVWQYQNIRTAMLWIAADWQSDAAPVIAYDLYREIRDYWWVPAWHTISTEYRMGMAHDFVLLAETGLTNANQAALGAAAEPDYIVLFAPGIARYVLDDYTVFRVGQTVILKPNLP